MTLPISLTIYCCPVCKTRTGSMRIVEDEINHMTETDIANRPDLAKTVGYEVLLCPCGLKLNWFTVEEVVNEYPS